MTTTTTPKKRTPRVKGEMPVLSIEKLKKPEIRCLVANYYMAQELRLRANNQMRSMGDKEDPAELIQFYGKAQGDIEKAVLKNLEEYATADPAGRWILSLYGMGPVIAAGFIAHLDVEESNTAGGFWRYAGLDPTAKWEKGQKRPYNADVKQICFHAGTRFVYDCNKAEATLYSRLYKSRKELVVARNNDGFYAERCKSFFTHSADVKKKLAKGMLPDFNLHAQARNYAVKIFMSHLHTIMYLVHYNRPPPAPFTLAILGHADLIAVPNLHLIIPDAPSDPEEQKKFFDWTYGRENSETYQRRLESANEHR
jgi:hypothetical protein